MMRVTWEIDVEANTAREAAEKALAIQRKPESAATVFDVVDGHGKKTRIDLDELEEDGALVSVYGKENG